MAFNYDDDFFNDDEETDDLFPEDYDVLKISKLYKNGRNNENIEDNNDVD